MGMGDDDGRIEKTKDVADRKNAEVKGQETWWLNH